jgi:long-chain acyl-CoA synthetase
MMPLATATRPGVDAMSTPCSAGRSEHDVERGIGRIAIGDIIRRSARRFGSRTAVVDSARAISFRELDEQTNRFANYLLSLNLNAGSRIATICINSIELLIAIYGINKAGLVWVPLNVGLAAEELSFVLSHSGASLIVIDQRLAAQPGWAAMARATAQQVLQIGSGDAFDFSRVIQRFDISEPVVSIHERDLAIIMYTSGTTSRPKGVMHCHLAVYFAVLGNIGEWSLTRNDTLLITLPLFHVAAHVMVTTFLTAGAGVVLRSAFDAADMTRDIEHHRVSVTIGMPMMYAAALDHPDRKKRDLTCLRLCIYVMAAMPWTLLVRLIDEFCPNFALTTGQTEMYPMTMMFRPEQQLQRFGNYWGESATINDTAIMDENGNLLDRGGEGEVVHRGPNVMLGYYRDPAATAKAQKFGWHHTGDIGKFDGDDQLLFTDRKKDIIKSGGESVSSVSVEEVLLRHPSITSAAAVGIPHPRWGEAVVAFVTMKDGSSAADSDILLHCRNHLGVFQVPKAVVILDSLPTTGSGKVRKAELRGRYKDFFSME